MPPRRRPWLCSCLFLLTLLWAPGRSLGAVELTGEERSWLAANQDQLQLWYDRKFPPIEHQSESDSFEGLAAEVIRLIETRLDVTLRKTPAQDWKTQLRALESGESAVAPVIVRTPERERFAFFSRPYLTVPVVIITTRHHGGALTLDDLRGLRVAAVQGYVSESFLNERYAGIFEIVPEKSVQEGLRDVSFGVVDAMVENLAVAAYYIDQEKLPNLRVAGTTELEYPLSFAVSRRYPLLFSAMEKALADIPPAELEAVRQRWIRLEPQGGLSPEERRWIGIGALFLVTLLCSLAVMSWLLRRRLKEKMASLEWVEWKLLDKTERLKLALEATSAGIWDFFPHLGQAWYNPLGGSTLNYAQDSAPQTLEDWAKLIHPGDLAALRRTLREYVDQGGPDVYEAEFRMRDQEGNWRWLLSKGRVIERDEQGRPTRIIGLNLDIHKLKQVQEALRESEALARAVFDQTFQLIGLLDRKGRIISFNKTALAFLGLSHKEVQGLPFAEGSWWPDKAEAHAVCREAVAVALAGGVFRREIRQLDGQGEERAVDFSMSPFTDEAGLVRYLIPEGRDVTDRKRAEVALQASEQKYRAIFNNAPMGIFRTTVQGRFAEANPTLARMLGYGSREELLTSIRDLAADLYPSPDARRRLLDAVIASPGGVRLEIEFKRKDGTPFHAIINASLQMDEAGRPAFLDGAIEDISERKRAEEALKASEIKFSRLFQLSPDAIALARLDDGRILDVNEAFSRLFHRDKSDVAGRTVRDLGLYRSPEAGDALQEILARGDKVENREVEARRGDGAGIICSLSCQRLDVDGESCLLTVFRDITETKRMQEMMIQTEKMISVGGIAAGIAHEINNPLGIVIQAAQNVSQRLRPDFPKNARAAEAIGLDLRLLAEYMRVRKLDAFIEDIRTAALRASGIIRHMLDFSRRSESKRNLCDLKAIIAKAVTLAQSDYDLKKSYDFKSIQVNIEAEADLPLVSCTETEIEQVFLNLLRNAAQAMVEAPPPPGGPRIDIRLSRLPGKARIELEDNGPGMPPEVQRRAFEPFFTTKGPGVGTGLGLSVSYFIVTKGHDGAMSVTSRPGGGARFIIDLPSEEAWEACA